jgi:hypothetical protein
MDGLDATPWLRFERADGTWRYAGRRTEANFELYTRESTRWRMVIGGERFRLLRFLHDRGTPAELLYVHESLVDNPDEYQEEH